MTELMDFSRCESLFTSKLTLKKNFLSITISQAFEFFPSVYIIKIILHFAVKVNFGE